MIVLDASAAVEALLERPPRAEWVLDRLRGDTAHAPHLIDLETVSALRKLVRLGFVSADRATAAVRALLALPLTRYPATRLLDRIWELRGELTPYDASYVALAEALHAPLLTTDERLARSQGHRANVVCYPA